MKKLLFFLLLLIATIIQQVLVAKDRGILVNTNLNSKIGNTLIFNPTAPYVISTPGVYRLGGDVSVDIAESSTLIKITSSNVTLDLSNRTLSKKQFPSNKNITGIHIADNLSNVTIQNGNINNITGTGIIVGKNCFDITLANIDIVRAQSGGIELQSGTDTVTIYNCSVSKSLSTGKHNKGISLNTNNNVTISNCSCMGLRAPSGYNAFGIFAENSVDCTIQHCVANGNKGDLSAGFCLTSCNGFILENLEANGNKSNTGTTVGIELITSNGNIIENSTCNFNKGATHSYGIHIHSSSSYNQITQCTTACQKSSGSGNGYGICIKSGNNNFLKKITAFGNTGGTSTSSIGAGICLNNTMGGTINKSLLSFNNGGSGKGYGILLINNAGKFAIEENKFYHNHGSTGSWGIHEGDDTTSYIARNIAFGNSNNYNVEFSSGSLSVIEKEIKDVKKLPDTNKMENISITLD